MIDMKAFFKKNFPPEVLNPLLILFGVNCGVYYGAKMINILLGRTYVDMTGALDMATPVIPWFVFIYVAAFPFWYISYYFIVKSSRENCRNLLIADISAKLLCGLIFVLIPTTNVRPELASGGVDNWILNLIYTLDQPNNLFPSIHCLESWLCFAYIRDLKGCKWYVKLGSFLMAVAICLSTVFTRQHVWVDVVAGVMVAEFFRVFVPYVAGDAEAFTFIHV